MEIWEPPERSGFLPGTEDRWAEYYAQRNPFDRAVAYLRVGRDDFIDDAINLLRDRPRFHGSGYITERALRFIDRAPLTAARRVAVAAVAEDIAREGHTREAWEAMKLLVRMGVPGWDATFAQASERRAIKRGA